MQSKEEIILEVFREHSFDAAIFGGSAIVIPEDEWCRVVEQILSLLHPKQDTPPQLNKHDVSGWQDFATHPPKVGDEVILKNKMTERKVILRLQHYQLDFDGLKDNWWMPSPA